MGYSKHLYHNRLLLSCGKKNHSAERFYRKPHHQHVFQGTKDKASPICSPEPVISRPESVQKSTFLQNEDFIEELKRSLRKYNRPSPGNSFHTPYEERSSLRMEQTRELHNDSRFMRLTPHCMDFQEETSHSYATLTKYQKKKKEGLSSNLLTSPVKPQLSGTITRAGMWFNEGEMIISSEWKESLRSEVNYKIPGKKDCEMMQIKSLSEAPGSLWKPH